VGVVGLSCIVLRFSSKCIKERTFQNSENLALALDPVASYRIPFTDNCILQWLHNKFPRGGCSEKVKFVAPLQHCAVKHNTYKHLEPQRANSSSKVNVVLNMTAIPMPGFQKLQTEKQTT
jgi:hypothetical protein